MDVSSATTTATPVGGTGVASNAKKTTLDYDSFLTLLIAQLKNQDPTDPQDSAEYIAQLATFSNVEQGIKTNAKLDEMITAFSLSQAESVIGRQISSADGTQFGTVTSVRIITGGAVAVLDDGSEISLGAGVTIS